MPEDDELHGSKDFPYWVYFLLLFLNIYLCWDIFFFFICTVKIAPSSSWDTNLKVKCNAKNYRRAQTTATSKQEEPPLLGARMGLWRWLHLHLHFKCAMCSVNPWIQIGGAVHRSQLKPASLQYNLAVTSLPQIRTDDLPQDCYNKSTPEMVIPGTVRPCRYQLRYNTARHQCCHFTCYCLTCQSVKSLPLWRTSNTRTYWITLIFLHFIIDVTSSLNPFSYVKMDEYFCTKAHKAVPLAWSVYKAILFQNPNYRIIMIVRKQQFAQLIVWSFYSTEAERFLNWT